METFNYSQLIFLAFIYLKNQCSVIPEACTKINIILNMFESKTNINFNAKHVDAFVYFRINCPKCFSSHIVVPLPQISLLQTDVAAFLSSCIRMRRISTEKIFSQYRAFLNTNETEYCMHANIKWNVRKLKKVKQCKVEFDKGMLK